MKNISRNIAILLPALGLMVLAACSNILSPPPKADAGTGTVRISIGDDSAGARTLMPHYSEFSRYEISGEGPGEAAFTETISFGGDYYKELDAGEWIITVTAYTGNEYDGFNPVGEGRVTVEVIADDFVPAKVIITPITGQGKEGWLSYYVPFPSTVDNASLIIASMNSGGGDSPLLVDHFINLLESSPSGVIPLPAGYYLLNVRLEQGGKYAGRTEAVHIYDGLYTSTSEKFTFTDTDFNAVINLADGIWQEGEIKNSGDVRYYRFNADTYTDYALNIQRYDDQASDSSYTVEDMYITVYWEEDPWDIIPRKALSEWESWWSSPHILSTGYPAGNIIIKIEAYGSYTGTYAIGYYKANVLNQDIPVSEALAYRAVRGYKFSAEKDKYYIISWEDRNDQAENSSYTGDVRVSIRGRSTGGLVWNEASGYTAPQFIYSGDNQDILIRVEAASGGTYGLVYTELPVTPLSSDGQFGWTAPGRVDYYKFSAASGVSYEVSWEDAQTGYPGGDIQVTAYEGGINNSPVFGPEDEPLPIGPYSSGTTIYLKVEYNGIEGGYYIGYNADNLDSTLLPLIDGKWTEGNLNTGEGTQLYLFNVIAGTSYALSVQLDGYQASGSNYTASDMYVTLYWQSDETPVFGGILSNYLPWGSYDQPAVFTFDRSGSLIIKIDPLDSGTDTYAVSYATVEQVQEDTLYEGYLVTGDMNFYYMENDYGDAYYDIIWEDSVQNGGYTGTVNVSAWTEGEGILFKNMDSSYSPQSVSSNYPMILIRVEGTSEGSYSFKYTDTSGPVGTPLLEGIWEEGEITGPGEVQYYLFDVIADETYGVYWHDYANDPEFLDIVVFAYQSDGYPIFWEDVGYSSPTTFTATESGSVIVGVIAWNFIDTGAYEIKYEEQQSSPR
jgi:hypothetical protein